MKIKGDKILDLAGAIVFANLTYHLESGHLFHSLIEPFEKTGAAIFGGIATNHVGNLLKTQGINKHLFRKNPYDINGDLERIFKDSCVLSVDFMEQICTRELKVDMYKGDLKTWYAWQKFKVKLATHFKIYKELTQSHISSKSISYQDIERPGQELSQITKHLFETFPPEMEIEQVDKIKEIFTHQLPHCLDLAFKDALKNDEQGFKAFQIWMLQHISDKQRVQNSEILKAIANIKLGEDVLSRADFYDLLDRKASEIYDLLELQFDGVRELLFKFSLENRRHFHFLKGQGKQIISSTDRIYEVLSQTKQKVDGLSAAHANPGFVYPHFFNEP